MMKKIVTGGKMVSAVATKLKKTTKALVNAKK